MDLINLTQINDLDNIILDYKNQMDINDNFRKCMNELKNIKRKVEYDEDNTCDLSLYYLIEDYEELYVEINYKNKSIDFDYIRPYHRSKWLCELYEDFDMINDKIEDIINYKSDNDSDSEESCESMFSYIHRKKININGPRKRKRKRNINENIFSDSD
jgi:hypothetical protein